MLITQGLRELMKCGSRVILLRMVPNHVVRDVLKVQFMFVIGKCLDRCRTDQCVSGKSEIYTSNSVFLCLIDTRRTKSFHCINSSN